MKKFARTTAVALSLALILTGIPLSAAAENKTVILGGQPFGVKFYNDGVMIIELEEFFNGSRYVCPAKDGGLEVDDVIKKVNGIVADFDADGSYWAITKSGEDTLGAKSTIIADGDCYELTKTVYSW